MGDLSATGAGSLPANGQQDDSRPLSPAMDDPFISPQPDVAGHREQHRYSSFDSQLFSLNASSPAQARRALEAHLAETERRLEEASRLGTALVQQQQELSEKLKEVDQQQDDGEIGEDLRRKLVDLEREYNEIGRETARAFLAPKRLVGASDESNFGTPSGEYKSPLGSVMLSTQATNSPSRVTVPSRKQRNQPSNRVHDIEFATEISTSLLAQVRQLQALLAEREEALKGANLEKSRLELEAEGYAQRIRALDESEQRYKDENWSLETQTHELMTAVKEAAERETKLNSSLSSITAEKSSVERELEELKQLNTKLVEDHTAAQKANDAEIHLLRRNLTAGDAEKLALQRKLEEVTSQNQELAKAVAATIRQQREAEAARSVSHDDETDAQDQPTPEQSPPSSPTKPTPRHNHLETETLRSSLGHAHRMIQNLKNTIHREKAEKIELKRILQESRDELEQRRRDSVGATTSNKRQKTRADPPRKQPRPDLLGAGRRGKTQVEWHDTDWEDSSPSHPSMSRPPKGRKGTHSPDDPSDYQTATEDAFETANEPDVATESEAFQTGLESMADDSSDTDDTERMTETEFTVNRTPRRRLPSPLLFAKARDRNSIQSTASTSADEDEDDREASLSPTQVSRYRLRVKRGGLKRIRPSGEAPMASHSRPSSARESTATSFNQDPMASEGQSLFAELAELGSPGSEGGDFGPPIRDDAASQSSTPRISGSFDLRRPSESTLDSRAKPVMVDTGVMTDHTISPHSVPETAGWFLGLRNGFWLRDPLLGNSAPQFTALRSAAGSNTDEWSTQSVPSQMALDDLTPNSEETEGLAFPPLPQAVISSVASQETVPVVPTVSKQNITHAPMGAPEPLEKEISEKLIPERTLSSIYSQHTEPVTAKLQERDIPELAISHVNLNHTEPESAVPVELAVSMIESQYTKPEYSVPMEFKLSSVYSEHTEPKSTVPLELVVSSITSEQTVPKSTVPLELEVSSITSEQTVPKSTVPLELTVSSINSEQTEPKSTVPLELSVSSINSEHTEPMLASPVELTLSSMISQNTEPTCPAPLELAVSSVGSEQTQPQDAAPAKLAISAISSTDTAPADPTFPLRESAIPVGLAVSSINSGNTDPVTPNVPESARTIPSEVSTPSVSSEHDGIPTRTIAGSERAIHTEQADSTERAIPVELAVSSISEQAAPLASKAPEPVALTVTSIFGEQHTEPVATKVAEPKYVELSVSPSASFSETEPVVPKLPERIELAVSSVSSEYTTPVVPRLPEIELAKLAISSVCSEHTEPVIAKLPELEPRELAVSSVCSEHTEPVMAKMHEPEHPELAVSSICSENTAPITPKLPEVERPELGFSSVSFQDVPPAMAKLPEPQLPDFAVSSIFSELTEPVLAMMPEQAVPVERDLKTSETPELDVSPVKSAWTEPTGPTIREVPVKVPELLISNISSVETQPVKSEHRKSPATLASVTYDKETGKPTTVPNGYTSDVPVISVARDAGLPLDSVSGNALPRAARQSSRPGKMDGQADQGAQTILSSRQIDAILMDRVSNNPQTSPDNDRVKSMAGSSLSTPKARHNLEGLPSSTASNRSGPVRPGSSSSQTSYATGRQILSDMDDRRTIDQPSASSGVMGPPLIPASALKAQRPLTPNDHVSQTGSIRQSSLRAKARHNSQLSHRSSVSSFASELEERFNIQTNPMPTAYGYGAGTDPRMIQAITQTMIGEFLWKYTRKAVSGEMSSTRHRRYFWVHPYTRTLYWSAQDPQSAGKSELRTKSVHIEAIRVVADDNPYPPGLHCQSLEVISPGRRVRFTASTSQRHETWFNALSYLLLRNADGENGEENEGNISLEEMHEFNAGLANSQQPGRSSFSSYSRSLRSVPKQRASSVMSTRPAATYGDRSSPAFSASAQSPALYTPGQGRQGSATRISSFFNSSVRGSFSSRKMRRGHADSSLYEESVGDPGSVEDLRHAFDRQDEDEDRLENVRACCDGKHDVSSLSRSSRYSPKINRHQPY